MAYSPATIRRLARHYRCCFVAARWCAGARREANRQVGRTRGRRAVATNPALAVVETKADFDRALLALPARYADAILILIDAGPGQRDLWWWLGVAAARHTTPSTVKGRIERACRAMARTLAGERSLRQTPVGGESKSPA